MTSGNKNAGHCEKGFCLQQCDIEWKWALWFLTSILGNSIHILMPHLSHVAQNSKNHKAGQKAGEAVH